MRTIKCSEYFNGGGSSLSFHPIISSSLVLYVIQCYRYSVYDGLTTCNDNLLNILFDSKLFSQATPAYYQRAHFHVSYRGGYLENQYCRFSFLVDVVEIQYELSDVKKRLFNSRMSWRNDERTRHKFNHWSAALVKKSKPLHSRCSAAEFLI